MYIYGACSLKFPFAHPVCCLSAHFIAVDGSQSQKGERLPAFIRNCEGCSTLMDPRMLEILHIDSYRVERKAHIFSQCQELQVNLLVLVEQSD